MEVKTGTLTEMFVSALTAGNCGIANGVPFFKKGNRYKHGKIRYMLEISSIMHGKTRIKVKADVGYL